MQADKKIEQLQQEIKKLESELQKQKEEYSSIKEEYQSSNEELQSTLEEIEEAYDVIRENEKKYRLLYENAGIAIGYYKPDGKIISYNNIAAEHIGKPTDFFCGKHISEIFPEKDANKFQKRIKIAAETDRIFQYEDEAELPTGNKWFTSIYSRITDQYENIQGVQVFSYEITEKKKNQIELQEKSEEIEAQNEELRQKNEQFFVLNNKYIKANKKLEEQNHEILESEERFKLLSEVTFEGIILHKNGVILDVNRSFERITGYTKKQAVGSDMRKVLITEEDKFKVGQNIIKEYAAPYRIKVRRKNNTFFTAEIEARNIKYKNDIIRIAALRDITEKVKAEKALKESETRYRKIFENTSFGIFQSTPDKGYITMNQAFANIFGFDSPADMISKVKNINSLYVRSADREKIKILLATAGKIHGYEAELYHQKGHKIWISIYATSEIDENGEIYYEGTIEEITQRKKAEIALVKSERKFRAMAENFPTGAIFLFDKNLKYKMVAGSELQKVGINPEDCIGKTVYEYFPSSVSNIAGPKTKKIFEGINSYYEVEFLGNIYANWATGIKNEEGEIEEGLVYTLKITDLKNKEKELIAKNKEYASLNEEYISQNEELHTTLEELQAKTKQLGEKEKLHRNISELTSDYIYSAKLSRNGDITTEWMIGAVKRITGYTVQEIEKMNHGFASLVYPPDLQYFFKNKQPSLYKMKSIQSQYRIIHKDGTTKWLYDYIKPLPCENEPAKIQLLGAVQDITKIKETEIELKQSSDFLNSIISNLPIGLQIFDKDGYSEKINHTQKELLGIPNMNEGIGKFNILTDPQSIAHGSDKRFKEVYEKGVTIDHEFEYNFDYHNNQWNTKKGKRHFRSIIFPLFDEGKKVSKVITLLMDVTENKKSDKLRNEAEIAQKTAQMKQQLLANISHEMRTPMNGIIGMANFLYDTNLSQQQKEYVGIIKESSESLKHIIKDVLDLSKIEQGKMNMVPEATNLRKMLKNTVNMFSEQANQKGIVLNYQVDEQFSEYILIDKNRLKQIIYNLVSNAIKYTREGNINIDLKVVEQDSKVITGKAMIKDTGVGIDKDDLQRVFDTFTRIENGYSRYAEGTGLGLSICKGLAKLLGGDIHADSEPGKGSAFWFTFKASQVKNEHLTKNLYNIPDIRPYQLKILLAEDKIVNQKVAKMLLEKQGCKVTIANNGKEAIEKYEDNKFDIILMDILMPEMDGVKAMKVIKEKSNKPPPIIALSAYALEGDSNKYIQMGMDDYIEKPIDKTKMIQKLFKWTKEHRKKE